MATAGQATSMTTGRRPDMVTSVKPVRTNPNPVRTKSLDRSAGWLSAGVLALVLGAGLVSAGLVGCVGEQTVGEPSDETVTTTTEQIDEAAATVAASPAPINAAAPARDKLAPASLPQLDLLPATEGAAAGAPADPKAADPKASQSNTDLAGSDRMDPEPCPWTQKVPPS